MKLLLNASLTFSSDQRAALLAGSPDVELIETCVDSPEKLDGEGVSILVTEQVPRDLSGWKDLRWVQLLSAGANHLRDHPIQQTSIVVTNASGTHGVPIAQFVTCATLMLVHRMPRLFDFKATRKWPDRVALSGSALRGRTAGILGYGSIGRECARQLSALGMRIVCLKRDPGTREDGGFNAWPDTGDPEGRLPSVWYGPAQLSDMLTESDVIVVTAPSTPVTEGMIGERELRLCKPTAHLIIISRGGIVLEQPLADALRTGTLAGAAVDCFVKEPLPPDHVFFDTPNLIMTPHMSGIYDAYWPALNDLLLQNLRRFRSGTPLLNQVSRKHGY